MTTPAAFARQRRSPWRDARLWSGIALVLVSTIGGALVLGRDDGSVQVWRATRDLAPGAMPEVEPARIAMDGAEQAYVSADAPLAGRLLVPVAAGALIPAAALTTAAEASARAVTVPIAAGHAPIGLAVGDRVDVWSTPTDVPDAQTASISATPRLVLASVTVQAVAADALGVGGELPIALEVDEADVAALVDAMRTGVVDLVAVPFDVS